MNKDDVICKEEGFTGIFMTKSFSRYYSAFVVNVSKFVFLLNCTPQTNVNKSPNTKMRHAQVHQTPKFIGLSCIMSSKSFFQI